MNATEDEQTEAIAVLIRRCAYREALEATVELLGDELGRFCMAVLGDQALASKAQTQLLVGLHGAIPTLGNRPLRPFLYQRALGICEMLLDGVDEGARKATLSLTPPDTRRLPADARQAQDSARQVRRALASLRGVERSALLLRYAAGLEYDAIGEILAIDVETTKKRIGKGLLGVRQSLQELDA